MNYILSREEMATLFNSISKDFETYGAVEKDGEVIFDRVDDFGQISEKKSRYAPKEFLIKRNENVLLLEEQQKKAVFGIKSCDLKGFYLMDKQVLNRDPFYTERRNKTLFVNFVCESPCEGGFCSSFGGPVLNEFEIQVLKSGNEYHIMVSDKYDKYFEKFRKEGESFFADFKEEFKNKMPPLKVEGLERNIKWNSSLWKDFASRCISCGACNFSCPTCYCFDLYDEGEERKREWDSCILSGFTSSSAGNIRNGLEDRLRQRFYHKFVYFKKAKDEFLCSGCNRCVDDCPVGIDIKEVITHDYSSE
ncbi:MAG: 4Fe-4S dicluster domain-containing protein [Thermoplasmatales archaeon]